MYSTEPKQRVTLVAYGYNERGELVSATDALGQSATYQYQDRLLVQETFKNGLNFYFEYTGSGSAARCVHTWGDEGIYDHKLVYDVDARRTVVTNSLGYATTYQGNANGLVVEVQDARGGVTLTEYNEFNEVLRQTNALGYASAYTYDEQGNYLLTTRPDTTVLQRTYDAQNQLTQLVDAAGGQWQWVYDLAGNMLTETSASGSVKQYTYAQGRLKSATDSAKQLIEFSYDEAGNLTELRAGATQRQRCLYDGWGRARKLTDVRGNVQWREYDLAGRIVVLYEPDGNIRRFTYDGLDNVVRVQDRYHDVQYAYRGRGRLIRRVEAGTAVEFWHDTEEQLRAVVNEHGLMYRFELDRCGSVVKEVGFDGLTRRYQRNQAGQVLAVELASGQRTRYRYDQAGNLSEVRYDDGSWEKYTYRPDGALLTAVNEATTVSFVRDRAGNILSETQGSHTITSEYDTGGYQIGLTSSLGAEVRYTRDNSGHLLQMQSKTWSALFERDAQGLEVQRTLSGNVRTQWKRDSFGRPLEQRVSFDLGRSERARTYSWQETGRLAQIQDSQHGAQQFSYDTTGNLSATLYGDNRQEFRLPDAVGNLFTTADRRDRQYGPSGKLLAAGGTRYEYDERGNLVRKTTLSGSEWCYRWTASGRLADVTRPNGTSVRFTYDALGRRLTKAARGQVTHWVWQGDQLLHEWVVSEAATTRPEPLVTWLFEEGQLAPLAQLRDAEPYSVVCDHLGTPLQLHDRQGRKTWAAELNSYGAVRESKGQLQDCPFRYQGQYEDPETGLYYNRFRYYDPEAGSYISQDPIGLLGGDKAYSYVHNPNSYIDPFGLAPWPTGGFGQWFNSASAADVLANKEDVSSALQGSGGMHEMFPVSMASKAKELGFTHAELMARTTPTSGLTFNNVPDRFGTIHSGPHSTGMPLPAGQSGKASSWFHKNLMTELQGATTKADAIEIIERHHNNHCP